MNKKLLSVFALILACLMVCIGLTSCGGGNDSGENLNQHLHDYANVKVDEYLISPATCTESAVYYQACKICGAKGNDNFSYGTPVPHDYSREDTDEEFLKAPANCTTPAEYYKSCVFCGQRGEDETFFVGDAGHSFSADWTFDDIGHWHQATCAHGSEIDGYEGHSMVAKVADEYLLMPADCGSPALYVKSCSTCGYAKTAEYATADDIFSHGAPVGEHDFTATVAESGYLCKAATCTQRALYYKSCTRCGLAGEETFESGSLKNHNSDSSSTDSRYLISAADCENAALYYKSCSSCGAASSVTFSYGSPLDHSYTKEDTANNYLVSEADCENAAVYNKSCERCGRAGGGTFIYGSPLDHSFVNEVPAYNYLVSEADCDNAAVYNKSCERCGKAGGGTFTYGESIGHSYTEELVADKYLVSEADCENAAVYNKSCVHCGKAGGGTFMYGEADPSAHKFSGGVCEYCESPAYKLIYKYDESNDAYIVTGFEFVYVDEIEIPAFYEGKTVRGVGDDAFLDSKIKGVTLPESLVFIGNNAFKQSEITSITIPSNVLSIGYNAFTLCNNLITVNFNAIACGNSAFDARYGAFNSSENITTVNIGSGVTVIPTFLFYNCPKIDNVIIPNNVTKIERGAFRNCDGLTKLTIGKNLTSIGIEAFSGCDNLDTVIWNAENCAWDRDRETPFDNSNIRKLVIGEDVRRIANCLFYELESIQELEIKNGVESIGREAFLGLKGIKELTIPESLTVVGAWGFHNCTALTTVNWNAISCECHIFSYNIFNGCTNITNVTFGEKVEDIPANLFYECPLITEVKLPAGLKTIGDGAFAFSSITSIEIPEGVESIENGAFQDCAKLKSVTIPDSVTKLGNYVFIRCTSLETAVVGTGVTVLSPNLFKHCTSLVEVTVGEITKMEAEAFGYCTNLRTINFGGSESAWRRVLEASPSSWRLECGSISVKYAK